MTLQEIKYVKGLELLLVDIHGSERMVRVSSVKGDTAHMVNIGGLKRHYSVKLGSRSASTADRRWAYTVYLNAEERAQEREASLRYNNAVNSLTEALRKCSRSSTPADAIAMMEELTKLLVG